MPLNDDDFRLRLAAIADPTLLCDILDISSEDLIEAFEDKIEERIQTLKDVFDIDMEECFMYDD
tara:strand:+ start:3279 stop:3470 length:192 start_codon:yes stop_codon:yes gene_type:complete